MLIYSYQFFDRFPIDWLGNNKTLEKFYRGSFFGLFLFPAIQLTTTSSHMIILYNLNDSILGLRSSNPKRCNMIDINSESSISGSNSNSAMSKTPTSVTLAGDSMKDELVHQNQTCASAMLNNCLTVPTGYKCEWNKLNNSTDFLLANIPSSLCVCVFFTLGNATETHSDIDIQPFSISEASMELRQWNYSNSDHSLQSLKSIARLESQCEDDTLEFIKRYVEILFENCAQLTLELKSEFGLKSRVSYVLVR